MRFVESRNWRLCWTHSCLGYQMSRQPSGGTGTLACLREFGSNSTSMAELRRTLGEGGLTKIWRWDDDTVRERVRDLLERNRLLACERVDVAAVMVASAPPAPAQPWPCRERIESSPKRGSREPSPEPLTFSADVDLDRVAAARREAARLGGPFCEECQRARLAQR